MNTLLRFLLIVVTKLDRDSFSLLLENMDNQYLIKITNTKIMFLELCLALIINKFQDGHYILLKVMKLDYSKAFDNNISLDTFALMLSICFSLYIWHSVDISLHGKVLFFWQLGLGFPCVIIQELLLDFWLRFFIYI